MGKDTVQRIMGLEVSGKVKGVEQLEYPIRKVVKVEIKFLESLPVGLEQVFD